MSNKGLTLSEVLVAIAIVAIAILSLSAVLAANLQQAQQSEHVTIATQVASDFIEEAKVLGKVPLTPPSEFDGRNPDPINSIGFPNPPYPKVSEKGRDYTLVVKVVDNSDATKGLTVEVWWNENQKVTLGTHFVVP